MLRTKSALYISVLIAGLATGSCRAQGNTPPSALPQNSSWQTIKDDYRNFYSDNSLTHLGIAFGVGAVMANTHIDQGIRDWYQAHLRTNHSNHVSKSVKKLGNGYYMIPLSLLAMGIGHLSGDPSQSTIGQWGWRSFRAYLVGGPATLVAQELTGSERPNDTSQSSHWRPFYSYHGVSGNAFVGAIPFLTIADMSRNPFIRYSAYFASAIGAWTRVNDDAHYPSQVFLGWYMAYQATNAVSDTDSQQRQTHIALLPWPHGVIVAMNYHW